MRRMAHLGRVKPGKQQEYIEKHSQIWPEMHQALKDAGYINITSFLHDCDLFVYYEVDEKIFDKGIKELDKHPEMVKWSKMIQGVYDEDFKIVHYDEVFHLE
jgi:L-rhamnose mutarotase